jgi:hypothetical protein
MKLGCKENISEASSLCGLAGKVNSWGVVRVESFHTETTVALREQGIKSSAKFIELISN